MYEEALYPHLHGAHRGINKILYAVTHSDAYSDSSSQDKSIAITQVCSCKVRKYYVSIMQSAWVRGEKLTRQQIRMPMCLLADKPQLCPMCATSTKMLSKTVIKYW